MERSRATDRRGAQSVVDHPPGGCTTAGTRTRTDRGVVERIDPESGQVGILIIGYLLVSLLVVTVVLAVSAVYIEHKQLLSAADGAALAAADNYSIAVDTVNGAATPLPALQDSGVEGSTAGYLAATGADGRFDQLAVDPATGAPDGRTARVVLTAVVRPPIVNFLIPDGIPIVAQSDARAELTR